MYKVSYMGNGTTTEFTFNFPYFENSNVVVTKNGVLATGYNIVGVSGGADADFPFTGGTVVFDAAPSAMDSIIISRQLPLNRIADYQPTARIEPTVLNQDLNYLIELLKDRKDELDVLSAQYAEITDTESVQVLLSRIAAIRQEIATVSQQMEEFGDLTQISTDITALQNSTTGMLDYVIASQAPAAENGYTWYRKYKSGWVEQGGMAQSVQCVFPIPMANTDYVWMINSLYNSESTTSFAELGELSEKTTTGMKKTGNAQVYMWSVRGIAAT